MDKVGIIDAYSRAYHPNVKGGQAEKEVVIIVTFYLLVHMVAMA